VAYRKHYLLQWSGTLYAQGEIFSNSLRLAPPVEALNSVSVENAQSLIDDAVADLRAYWTLANHVGAAAVIRQVKLNPIGEDGLYLSKTNSVERILTGTTGATAVITPPTSANVPPQIALAVTLHTARQRGPGSKGRFFLPLPTIQGQLGADGRISEANATTYRTAARNFLNALNNWPGLDAGLGPRVVVATPGGRNMPEGDNVPVTHVSVGRVLDTQRKRRNAMLEDAQLVAL
jgi:hypothetical protein